MNRQGQAIAAHASITPQHVQQGLFVMLAIIVTLLVCQQYQRWTDAHTATPVTQHSFNGQHLMPAVATASQRPVLQQVEGTEVAAQAPQQPHWVF